MVVSDADGGERVWAVHTVEVGKASLDGGYGHVLCVFTVQSSPGAEPEPTSNKRESLCIA